jgi:SAM-dependent methyltransferase
MRKSKEDHLEMNRAAWDACHVGWFDATTDKQKFYKQYLDGLHDFDADELEMLGDVKDLDVLMLSCAGDASQVFSLAVLGANIWGCDFSETAIGLARENANKVDLEATFFVDDSQRLSTVDNNTFDLVFADYNFWMYEDVPTACKNWCRVLRLGGRLVLREMHPLSAWTLDTEDGKVWTVQRVYDDRTPEYSECEDSGPFSHGDPNLTTVEFPHTMADFVNAVIDSGLTVERILERTGEDVRGSAEAFCHLISSSRRESLDERTVLRRTALLG